MKGRQQSVFGCALVSFYAVVLTVAYGGTPVDMVEEPVLSPSHDRVAFYIVRKGDYQTRLWILSLRTGESYDTGVNTSIGSFPSWSRDETSVLLVSDKDGIVNYHLGSKHTKTLLEPKGYGGLCSGRYSSAGLTIGYVDRDANHELVLRGPAGRLTQLDKGVNEFCWT